MDVTSVLYPTQTTSPAPTLAYIKTDLLTITSTTTSNHINNIPTTHHTYTPSTLIQQLMHITPTSNPTLGAECTQVRG